MLDRGLLLPMPSCLLRVALTAVIRSSLSTLLPTPVTCPAACDTPATLPRTAEAHALPAHTILMQAATSAFASRPGVHVCHLACPTFSSHLSPDPPPHKRQSSAGSSGCSVCQKSNPAARLTFSSRLHTMSCRNTSPMNTPKQCASTSVAVRSTGTMEYSVWGVNKERWLRLRVKGMRRHLGSSAQHGHDGGQRLGCGLRCGLATLVKGQQVRA